MLLVMALGFGREVLHWWHGAGTPPAAIRASRSLGRRRRTACPGVRGPGVVDPAAGVLRSRGRCPAALQAACRAAIVDSRPRGESADAAEQELLKRLAGERPVAEEPGQWRLYRWGEGHPVLIGTRAVEQGAGSGSRSGQRRRVGGAHSPALLAPGTNLDETPYRVVIWGIAIPAARKDAWTLYLFQSGGAAGGQGQPRGRDSAPAGRTSPGIDPRGGRRGNHGLFRRRWRCGPRVLRPLVRRSRLDGRAGWQQVASGWHARFEMAIAR